MSMADTPSTTPRVSNKLPPPGPALPLWNSDSECRCAIASNDSAADAPLALGGVDTDGKVRRPDGDTLAAAVDAPVRWFASFSSDTMVASATRRSWRSSSLPGTAPTAVSAPRLPRRSGASVPDCDSGPTSKPPGPMSKLPLAANASL